MSNGLSLVPDDAEGVVGIHDGVRPFPAIDVISNCYATARSQGAVIPVIPVVETVRHLEDNDSRTVSRDEYRLVQTPQTFDIQLLKRAYRQPFTPMFTDDASVVEALGEKIALVDGNRANIKITTPFDLKIAEAILKN